MDTNNFLSVYTSSYTFIEVTWYVQLFEYFTPIYLQSLRTII